MSHLADIEDEQGRARLNRELAEQMNEERRKRDSDIADRLSTHDWSKEESERHKARNAKLQQLGGDSEWKPSKHKPRQRRADKVWGQKPVEPVVQVERTPAPSTVMPQPSANNEWKKREVPPVVGVGTIPWHPKTPMQREGYVAGRKVDKEWEPKQTNQA